jgi:hypothetical protein
VIQNLYIGKTKTKVVGENAFNNLTELKWIDLRFNDIEYLNKIIFKNNLKLEYVGFYANKIKMINPKFFENLNNLIEVKFDGGNICVDKEFKKSESTLVEMNKNLQICYNNCLLDIDCLSESVEDSKNDTKIKTFLDPPTNFESIKLQLQIYLTKPVNVINETYLNFKSIDANFDEFLKNEKLKITKEEFKEMIEIKSRGKEILELTEALKKTIATLQHLLDVEATKSVKNITESEELYEQLAKEIRE